MGRADTGEVVPFPDLRDGPVRSARVVPAGRRRCRGGPGSGHQGAVRARHTSDPLKGARERLRLADLLATLLLRCRKWPRLLPLSSKTGLEPPSSTS